MYTDFTPCPMNVMFIITKLMLLLMLYSRVLGRLLRFSENSLLIQPLALRPDSEKKFSEIVLDMLFSGSAVAYILFIPVMFCEGS